MKTSNKMKPSNKMPLQIWILTLSAFAIGTAEFVIAGILNQVSESLNVTVGQAGYLITAYAMSIVIGGPILTLWLTRYDKTKVLIGLMILFVISNLISAFSGSYSTLIVSRIMAGLTQGPFYGIGAVVATKLVSEKMAGRAVGQMFAGLTLANVLGVPAGAWIGYQYGWNITFIVVAFLGLLAAISIAVSIPSHKSNEAKSITSQLEILKNRNLLASLLITVLGWVGFMTLYGYIQPIAEQIAGFQNSEITWVLVVVGIGLVLGNSFGGKSADKNLSKSLIVWPIAMIVLLLVVGFLAPLKWAFLVAIFIFGIVSFANVPPLQMRVMKYGNKAPELASTLNISAFNLANAIGGIIGGLVIDSYLGTASIPYMAAIIPILGVGFIISQEYKNLSRKKTTPTIISNNKRVVI